ncbi:hypothetical protein [Catenovulum sediminis]|uniref:Uncharacterized protein n=1 Tax=Catenovulum sediminis TaxID=1740262 RepID=A0ABV1RBT7_9ALTE
MNLNRLIYLVTPYCPNVPDFVFEATLLECARDYFEKTHAWVVDGEAVVNEGGGTFEIAPPETYQSVVQVVGVENLDTNRPLLPMVDFISSGVGTPTHYKVDNRNTITIKPFAQFTTNLKIKIAVRPNMSATELPERVVEENETALRYGCVSLLKMQIGTDWHDPHGAHEFKRLYEAQISSKKLEIHTKSNPNAIELAYPH